jgi:hypothetical protein
MPRTGSASGSGTRAKDILQAYSLIHGKIRPEGSLKDLQKHLHASDALEVALHECWDDTAVIEKLVLRSKFPKQLLASVATALQQVAAAGTSVGPYDAAPSTAASLTGAIAMLLGCYAVGDCQTKIVDALKNSVRISGQRVAAHALCRTESSLGHAVVKQARLQMATRIAMHVCCCAPGACMCTLPPASDNTTCKHYRCV